MSCIARFPTIVVFGTDSEILVATQLSPTFSSIDISATVEEHPQISIKVYNPEQTLSCDQFSTQFCLSLRQNYGIETTPTQIILAYKSLFSPIPIARKSHRTIFYILLYEQPSHPINLFLSHFSTPIPTHTIP